MKTGGGKILRDARLRRSGGIPGVTDCLQQIGDPNLCGIEIDPGHAAGEVDLGALHPRRGAQCLFDCDGAVGARHPADGEFDVLELFV